jgi:hypothetical protein
MLSLAQSHCNMEQRLPGELFGRGSFHALIPQRLPLAVVKNMLSVERRNHLYHICNIDHASRRHDTNRFTSSKLVSGQSSSQSDVEFSGELFQH